MKIERFITEPSDSFDRYVELKPDPDGTLCLSSDVEKLEAEHAAVCAHMMRLFYALVNFTNPQPDDDAAEVMAQAKQAVELYMNDPSTCVTVELPDDESEEQP